MLRSLRSRLFGAMLAVALVSVAVTGVLTFTLTRRDAQRAAAAELRDRAPEIVRELRGVQRVLRVRSARGLGTGSALAARVLRSTLAIAGARVVTVRGDGTVVAGLTDAAGRPLLRSRSLDLPAGLDAAALAPERLAAGEEVEGVVDGTVFLALPVTTRPAGTTVLVLTQRIERSPAATTQRFFLWSALAATVAAAGAAILAARRLTRPIAAVGATARRLATGDLTARVPADPSAPTELAELGAVLDTMAGELERLRDAQRAFLLSITHDLRTPLTSIRGFAEAITDGVVGADELPRVAAVIQAEARRLGRLVDDLLALARLEAHRFPLHPAACDVAAVVAATVDAFAPQAAEIGVELAGDAPASLPAVLDPERFAQIVANLVENALRHASRRVTVLARQEPGTPPTIVLTVTDDGPGLDPHQCAQPFARPGLQGPSPPGRPVGSGLGLPIVAELAAAMGGVAELVHPGPGGTTFAVRVPASPPGTPGDQPVGSASTRTGPGAPSTATSLPGGTSRRT